jgi:hemolysin activation/secretion protein
VTLLRLSPDSERLRRIAKAHAAGELSTPDYRRIRAEVIERFAGADPADIGDNTERRWIERPAKTPVSDSAAAAEPRVRWLDRRRAYWLLLALALIAIGVGSATAWGATIPPVKQRDPNPATSPRIPVEHLGVRNFVAYPELGITPEAVDALLASALKDLGEASRPGPSGFTRAELDEIGMLLKSMGARDGAQLTEHDAAQLSALIAGQKGRRGASLVELEQVAGRLTQFYRAHGLPLATAYLPSQEVGGAGVYFEVLPGTLADVRVNGQSRVAAKLLTSAFSDQQGQPVERERVESAMYLINDLPGLDAQASFVAGEDVGSSDLNLVARNERSWDAQVRIDNEGDDHTGEERLIVDGSWFDPTGHGDALSAGVLATRNPENSYYGYLGYEAPLNGLRTRMHARISRDEFDYSNGQTELDGTADTAQIGATRILSRGRTRSVALDAGVSYQKLQLDGDGTSAALGTLNDQTLWFGSIGASTDRVYDGPRIALNGRIGVDGGAFDSGRQPGQSSPFYRLRVDGSAWELIPLPGFAAPQTLRLVFAGQVASTAMPGTLQMGLGGVGRVSAYDRSTASVDDGIFLGLELHAAPEAGRFGDFLLFANGGYGEIEREFDDDVSVGLASVGVGWDLPLGRWFGVTHANRFDAQLRFSVPVADKGSQDWINDDGVTLYWMLRYVP